MVNEIHFPHDHLILDACCVINLYYSGFMGEILASLQTFVAIADYVFREEVLRDKESGVLNLQPFIDSGLLTVAFLESEAEMITFINFATSMDDGEAATSAIAVRRNWAVATDDQKAIRVLKETVSQIAIVTTLELVRHWADSSHPEADRLRLVLENIRTLARYVPGVRHPLYDWWEAKIRV